MQKTETKSVKTEQPVKMNFSEALPLLKSENSKLMKHAYISEDHAQKFAEFFNFLEFIMLKTVDRKNLSLRRNPNLASSNH